MITFLHILSLRKYSEEEIKHFSSFMSHLEIVVKILQINKIKYNLLSQRTRFSILNFNKEANITFSNNSIEYSLVPQIRISFIFSILINLILYIINSIKYTLISIAIFLLYTQSNIQYFIFFAIFTDILNIDKIGCNRKFKLFDCDFTINYNSIFGLSYNHVANTGIVVFFILCMINIVPTISIVIGLIVIFKSIHIFIKEKRVCPFCLVGVFSYLPIMYFLLLSIQFSSMYNMIIEFVVILVALSLTDNKKHTYSFENKELLIYKKIISNGKLIKYRNKVINDSNFLIVELFSNPKCELCNMIKKKLNEKAKETKFNIEICEFVYLYNYQEIDQESWLSIINRSNVFENSSNFTIHSNEITNINDIKHNIDIIESSSINISIPTLIINGSKIEHLNEIDLYI